LRTTALRRRGDESVTFGNSFILDLGFYRAQKSGLTLLKMGDPSVLVVVVVVVKFGRVV